MKLLRFGTIFGLLKRFVLVDFENAQMVMPYTGSDQINYSPLIGKSKTCVCK